MANPKDTLTLPVISIIVPCYNQGKYLPEALESVLAQTYTNWECIIVNDGSTDDTEKIAQVYVKKDERIKYLYKENGGLSSARNAGINFAKGAWIQFLDSDDLLDNSKLQLSINASQQHPLIDIVISNFKLFVTDVLDTLEPYAPLSQECLSFEKLLYGWNTEFIIPIHSGFFKAELLKNNLFNEALKANEDWVMWLSIFKCKPKAIYIPGTYAYYRINPESMTKDPVFVHDSLVTAYKHIINYLAGEHSTRFSCMIIDRLNDIIKTRENKIQVLETTLVNKVIWRLKKTIAITLISLIICTRTQGIAASLADNIKNTIGVPYELVLINNSDNQLSIFSAYNEGVKQSRYPYLCFMHDDISYHTNNWGQSVISHFSDDDTGAIGIAGSPYVTLMPGSWWAGGLTNINIIPWDAQNNKALFKTYPATVNNRNQVISLDGVWFCIKKELFQTISFDEDNFNGFHAYDVDISFQVYLAGYKAYCVFDILIAHFSKGDMNHNWQENAVLFADKWQKHLPVACLNLSYTQQCRAEINTIQELVMIMLKNKTPVKQVYRTAFSRLSKFYKGLLYPPFILQISKYLLRSI